MRREGRVRGKPTSKSRVTGRCRSGKTRCRSCREHPVEKSSQKRRGRKKRFAVDVRTNPSLTDFALQPSLKQHRHPNILGWTDDRELDERCWYGNDADESAVQVGILAATVNSLIEAAAASARVHLGYGEDCELSSSGAILAGDGSDIAEIEEAFRKELGIFENAVEGSSFSETHFARKWGCVLSEESWSDVEFLESELESSTEEDDWFVVDGEDDV